MEPCLFAAGSLVEACASSRSLRTCSGRGPAPPSSAALSRPSPVRRLTGYDPALTYSARLICCEGHAKPSSGFELVELHAVDVCECASRHSYAQAQWLGRFWHHWRPRMQVQSDHCEQGCTDVLSNVGRVPNRELGWRRVTARLPDWGCRVCGRWGPAPLRAQRLAGPDQGCAFWPTCVQMCIKPFVARVWA